MVWMKRAIRTKMNLVVDANIIIRLVVGRRAPIDAAEAMMRGVRLSATLAQLEESAKVLVREFDFTNDQAIQELAGVTAAMKLLDHDVYAAFEQAARCRLHRKAQPDWPVLAAAMATDAGVWSDDRDFFGVGVPVWSSLTIAYADASSAGQAALRE